MVLLGDAVCRRFYPFVSLPHRLASAFLTGLLICSWWSYLAACLFTRTASPMLWGSVVFFVTSIVAICLLHRWPPKRRPSTTIDRETTRFKKGDWVLTGVFFVVACVMMFSTFSMKDDGSVRVAHHQSSDFGATVSIMQSFAQGRNFPTEYPHFSGDRIRYHFLYYFQGGNLEYLGLSPAFSNNLLSVLSLMSLLVLVMTLGTLVFGARAVGRLGAGFFFFHGSLSYITYFVTLGSLPVILDKIWTTNDFLSSKLPYRGEDWGVWSQVVYLNQRHLASSIGLFLMVLAFLMIRQRELPPRVKRIKPVKPSAPDRSLIHETNPTEGEEPLWSDGPADNEAWPGVDGVRVGEDTADPGGDASDQAVLSDRAVPVLPNDAPDTSAQIDPFLDNEVIGPDRTLPVEDDQVELEIPDVVEPSADVANLRVEELPLTGASERSDAPAAVNLDAGLLPGDLSTPDERASETVPVGPPFDKKVDEDDAAEPVETVALKPPFNLGQWLREFWTSAKPFVFSGVLLGLMPMWNGAIFAGAAAVLFAVFILYPLRREMIMLAAASALIALPQVIYLKTGLLRPADYSLLHWGYTISPPTFYNVAYYLIYTFGFKWLLIGVALIFANRLQRLFIIIVSTLVAVPLCFQFSDEVLANHKFFNMWLVMINIAVGFGLIKVWGLLPGKAAILSRAAACVLAILIITGGIIDFFPIKNSFWVEYKYEGDRLVDWVKANTDPNSIFLSHRFINHGILLAGRRLYYGHPYYAYSAGYPTFQRDVIYKKMFESMDVNEVFRLLKENKIDYVAIDNQVRKGNVIKKANEKLYDAYFPLVFNDTENKYDSLKIYSVPDALGPPNPNVELTPDMTLVTPGDSDSVNAFSGGEGNGFGQLSRPRGIAADGKGNFYVADTGNARVQKFDSTGKFVASLGRAGSGEGQLKEPNGIAVDEIGNIYIADAGNHKLIKLTSDGKFLGEWAGNDTGGFYGPRDVAIGSDKQVYMVDQGRNRIVKYDPFKDSFKSWGGAGNGEGQLNEATGVALGADRVFVADNGNNRIQVFDNEGNFVRQWEVPSWERYNVHFPDIVYDDVTKRLYVTNGRTNEVLAYDVDGNLIAGSGFPNTGTMENPSSMVILESGKARWLLVLNTTKNNVAKFELEAKR